MSVCPKDSRSLQDLYSSLQDLYKCENMQGVGSFAAVFFSLGVNVC